MGLLIDGAPEWAEVDGVRTPLRSDYRVGLLFERLMTDEELGQAAKAAAALRLYYYQPPKDAAAALRGILWFWSCGDLPEEDAAGKGRGGGKVFDFEADAAYIHAAFWADYGIDLCESGLHWWKFCGMLRALRPENLFCRIVEWRSADTSRLTGEERAFVLRMQEQYALPRPRAEAERDAAIARALAGGGDLRGVL